MLAHISHPCGIEDVYRFVQAVEMVRDALAGKGTHGDEFGEKSLLAPLLSGMLQLQCLPDWICW